MVARVLVQGAEEMTKTREQKNIWSCEFSLKTDTVHPGQADHDLQRETNSGFLPASTGEDVLLQGTTRRQIKCS